MSAISFWRATSCGRNSVPTAYSPGAGSPKPSFCALAAKNLCGICVRMPAPSPARGSAPTAPRCSRLSRMVSASSTILCDLRPLISAMNPTPQESFSRAGSNSPKPCALIVILALPRRGLCPCRGVEHSVVAARHSRSFSTASGGEGFWVRRLRASILAGGNLSAARRPSRPAVPGCLSAALRRALALGGWPPRVFARTDHPAPPGKTGRAARALGHQNRTAILSYAEHGRSRAIAQEHTRLPFCRGKKGTEEALKLMASAFAAFVFRNVLQVQWTTGCAGAQAAKYAGARIERISTSALQAGTSAPGFRGACHRPAHFEPDPLAQPWLPSRPAARRNDVLSRSRVTS